MQPDKVIEMLTSPLHSNKPATWTGRRRRQNEASLMGAYVQMEFPDPKGLLDTMLQDFQSFVEVCGFEGSSYPIVIRHGAYEAERMSEEGSLKSGYVKEDIFNEEFLNEAFSGEILPKEGFTLSVTKEQTILTASDTEGIRRGLVYIEDEMQRRGGACLPLGRVTRIPHVKSRISRSFFAPATHYGVGEELADEVDYYPEEYLNRLAHDGVNGLWIFVHFKTLLPSRIVPEYGQDSERRLRKLNAIVDKCAKYGIKVYALGTEPASTHQNPDILNHPDMLGASFWGGSGRAVCPSTEKGKAYMEETMTELFTLVPGLAGFIAISVGESVANCGGVATADAISCPHCKAKGLTKSGALAEYERIMTKAMKKVKPDAEFISWAYGHRGWTEEMIAESAKYRFKDVILMENFEDRGTEIQLGKPRTAIDYWLSYVGPGKVMETAVKSSLNGKVYAKLQVCNSHEIATLPYIPAPGRLYEKYQYMHEKGIEGAVYCWYFGNYPSLMNKAAGELAYWDFTKSKEEFLNHLASIYWGKDARKAALAWQKIEEGYSMFPVNVAFTWYGVVTDAIVRPLYLLPRDIPLSQNWLLGDDAGDRIGECLALGHTIEEAIVLCDAMYKKIQEGAQIISGLAEGENKEQANVAEALALLARSGTNVLRFYWFRNVLASGDPSVLDSMEHIIAEEIQNTQRMIELCSLDARLGYHSEAEGYKFNREMLEKRLDNLTTGLAMEMRVVRERIWQEKCPLAFFEEGKAYYTAEALEAAAWDTFEEGTGAVRIAQSKTAYMIEIQADAPVQIRAEFTPFIPYPTVVVDREGKAFFEAANLCMPEETEETEIKKWNMDKTEKGIIITIHKKDFDIGNTPIRLCILADKATWKKHVKSYSRLIWGAYHPEGYVWIK